MKDIVIVIWKYDSSVRYGRQLLSKQIRRFNDSTREGRTRHRTMAILRIINGLLSASSAMM